MLQDSYFDRATEPLDSFSPWLTSPHTSGIIYPVSMTEEHFVIQFLWHSLSSSHMGGDVCHTYWVAVQPHTTFLCDLSYYLGNYFILHLYQCTFSIQLIQFSWISWLGSLADHYFGNFCQPDFLLSHNFAMWGYIAPHSQPHLILCSLFPHHP